MVNKWVKWWLITGLVMLFIQVIVGGITRLTESGLSITKWEIVSGSLPPLSDAAWDNEFALYKETPQYKEINEGMSMSDFKFIYFWEWVHRFWARVMGFVFIIPFAIFYFRKWFPKGLLKDLAVVFLLALLAASFGWIMVASGLVKRPWVNAYKLSLHLCIAFSVFAYLLWSYLKYISNYKRLYANKITLFFTVLLWIQLFLGGVMSGMKAGVYYPTWPTMNGEIIPSLVYDFDNWTFEKFNNYDSYNFLPALIQSLHRLSAYILFFFGVYIVYIYLKKNSSVIERRYLYYYFASLILQIIIGIITVSLSDGEVPVLWGVLHQGGALILLSTTLILRYNIRLNNLSKINS
jgi:heme a synthase